MFRTKAVATFSTISVGIGAWIGTKYEQWKWRNHTKEGGAVQYYIPLPTVSAARPTGFDPPIQESGKRGPIQDAAIAATYRSQEIMRFGYPGFDQVRTFDNFVLSYDRRNRTANWVFEHLTPDSLAYDEKINRNFSEFKEDTSIHPYFRATIYDYKGSRFDRGHLAAANNHRVSQRALDQTFLLSNASPQVGEGFNRGAWNDLEKYIRAIARNNRNVYVCTGPLYLPRLENDGKVYVKYEVIGANHIAVPTHFFKVAVIENWNGELELLSFVLPNQMLPPDVPFKNYHSPIEAVERAAGCLLFDKVPRINFKRINGVKQF